MGERPSASSREQPNGHRAGEGILGPIPGSGFDPPPITSMGMIPDPSIPSVDMVSASYSHSSRVGSTPKMNFPKFDGVNPRLWQEQCEIYFEIYGVL